MGDRAYYVYILSNASRTLYIGVTNHIQRRVWQHRVKAVQGFTARYNVTRLVHFEMYADIRDAIAREKQLKSWLRAKKVSLINSMNPQWLDLAGSWYPQAKKRR